MIDYDKDSEEEFLEENAEDIKSVDNSMEEDDVVEEDEDEERKWIVPDGHLSEDEVSEQEDLLRTKENLITKSKSLMEILEIRKNYPKPVVLNFGANIVDPKLKLIGEILKAKILIKKEKDETNDQIENVQDFPIKISSKVKEGTSKKGGMCLQLKDRLDDVVREIHMSYMTKDFLIKLLNEKYPGIPKKGLDNFFRESCLKLKKPGHKVRHL